MRYFVEHLKGRHSFKRGIFVNLIGGYLISIAVSFGLNEIGVPLIFSLLLVVIVIIWGLSGLVSAALNAIWEKSDENYARQYQKFRAVFVIFFVVIVIALLLKDLFIV
jgi:Na+-transporting methylmalonyl-CoA/oxaloacetate decarboxylase gamma subunit